MSIKLSFKDFLTPKFLGLSFLPFIISAVLLAVFMIYGGLELFDALKIGAKSGDFSFLDEEKFPLIAKFLTFSITKWIISALFYFAGTFLVIILSLVIAAIVIGFLTPVVTKDINLKYYKLNKKDEPNFIRVSILMLKELGIFILLLLIALPFLFVPLVNIFVIHIPFFYMYYKFMLIDVSSNALNKERFERFYAKGGGYDFIFLCFLFYLVSLIPLLGIFLQILFVINLSHNVYQKEQNFRAKYQLLDEI
ncbi:EI24 domain-containing protein [Campylobacter corcagiensis]|uniref:EI24 domain-containing protein n=1 Tax=Campylobacter corcagiensis TaxID=1448857 RepID=A0A7M1LGH6_9BACT|nr:EI24 domain-containing protein [Campylobacter corcagiensis]QKF64106.1 EI24 domain-containing membrane protein [Campylobacter corcagiensis]QOQ87699.1 EI24 domain-containing protein [Campylobacter corcagiensis]